MRFTYPLLLISLFACSKGFSEYFFCVTKNGFPYNVNPNTKMSYKLSLEPLTLGSSVKLGDYYAEYKIKAEDLSGGQFSAWGGMGTPYGYFIYPSDVKDMGNIQDLVKDLIDQCQALIEAANRPEHTFMEIRASSSPLSGLTSYLQTGYPVLYLNKPTKENAQNIYRIKQ